MRLSTRLAAAGLLLITVVCLLGVSWFVLLKESKDGVPNPSAPSFISSPARSSVALPVQPALSLQLTPEEVLQVVQICERVMWRSIRQFTTVFPGGRVFVATGDIDDMWLRDSAVQFSPFLMDPTPWMKVLIADLITTHARLILLDPYANSFRKHFRVTKSNEELNRGGWVATGNWEPDSLAYFIHLLCDAQMPHLFQNSVVQAALDEVLRVFLVEQNHEAFSVYHYAELPNGGQGAASNSTGMVWGAFRPSDDMQQFGYNVPVNMWCHAALEKLQAAAPVPDPRVGSIMAGIEAGIAQWGVAPDGTYAYEVDGLGGQLTTFDDANLPSLLAAPMFYSKLNRSVYDATRSVLLSPRNPWFFRSAAFEGIGSPHTPKGNVWPLAVMARALTTSNAAEATAQVRHLLSMTCGTGTMHESVNVDNPKSCTRIDFEWANTMFVRLTQHFLPGKCNSTMESRYLTHHNGLETVKNAKTK